LPRGLGDDPLTRRKRNENPAVGSPARQVKSTSHNDVFFTRRTDGPQTESVRALQSDDASAANKTEIAEVTDIVRIAEIAQIGRKVEEKVEPVAAIEPYKPKSGGEVATPPAAETVVPPSISAANNNKLHVLPQKKNGFFRRLFGRLGK